jgi:hypothetical protein
MALRAARWNTASAPGGTLRPEGEQEKSNARPGDGERENLGEIPASPNFSR